MKLSPIADCRFGREVLEWGDDSVDVSLLEALHEHGILLFRNVRGLSSSQLARQVERWFPTLAVSEPSANRPADGGPVTVLGSTRDEQGNFNADYVPAATTGAPLLSGQGAWDSALESSLLDWIRRKQECAFMEWHTDATFLPWPTSYAALYCRQPGASATGFASATLGLERLPPELHELADQAVCTYRPSIIYGNAELGIPAIASRAVQLSAMRSGPHDMLPEPSASRTAGSRNRQSNAFAYDTAESVHQEPSASRTAGSRNRQSNAFAYDTAESVRQEPDGNLQAPPHPDDPVVRHTLVQTHPHTGQRSLRFSLKSLETLVPDWQQPDRALPPTDGKRAAWQIMRCATAGELAYLHRWREGDLVIWDERNSMHCRVAYDAANEVREMWRMVFRNDPLDQTLNESKPQLNLRHPRDRLG